MLAASYKMENEKVIHTAYVLTNEPAIIFFIPSKDHTIHYLFEMDVKFASAQSTR